ncbi:MAG TPA: LysM peptidoglycan-binding domain-containing protein [Firmicutes bacterium]|nr:LysM peptidoglycan-binding domain-containing protein [Bacillota bacterium]
MIEQPRQKKENVVNFSYLTVAVLLLFQISMIGGFTNSAAQQGDMPSMVSQDIVSNEASSELIETSPAQYKSVTVYQVEPGDSLYWIASTYGITVEELQRLNDLESDVIRVGQRLVVPLDLIKYYPAGVKMSAQEVEWLAQMIHAEARGEPYIGQVAVGAVIINRMLSPQFPNTLRGVLFQRNAFQPIQNGSFYMTPNESARKAALEALNGHDPTGGALFFFNPRQSSDRFMHSRPTKVTIGSHRFTN